MPKRINDSALFPPNMLIVPIPRLRIDRLSNTSENPQTAQIVVLDVVRSKATEETDGGGCGVELGEFVFVDGLPVSGGGGVHWGGLKDDG